MTLEQDTRAELARDILLRFRDKASGGFANLGDEAWWVEDMLDRIETAIVPFLASPDQD